MLSRTAKAPAAKPADAAAPPPKAPNIGSPEPAPELWSPAGRSWAEGRAAAGAAARSAEAAGALSSDAPGTGRAAGDAGFEAIGAA